MGTKKGQVRKTARRAYKKAKAMSRIQRKNIKMKHARKASKATGKPVTHFLKMYDYYDL